MRHTRNHLEKRFSDSQLKALDHHLFESPFEVSPRQIVIVIEVDHQIEDRFNVVSSGLVVSSARVKRGEHEVSREER